MTSLHIFINWKKDNYNFILVIIDQLIKIIYHKQVKITINIPGLVKVIINVVVMIINS